MATKPCNCSRARSTAFAIACAFVLAAATLPAGAQTQPKSDPKADAKAAPRDDMFSKIGRWFDDSFGSIRGQFHSAGEGVSKFNRDAGNAARATADAASDAAGTVARLPKTRIISGHQLCALAENGAPDCRVAADKLCQTKGMKSGTSLDITAAEECPVRVMTGAREAQPGECKNVTFVSRAVCQ